MQVVSRLVEQLVKDIPSLCVAAREEIERDGKNVYASRTVTIGETKQGGMRITVEVNPVWSDGS